MGLNKFIFKTDVYRCIQRNKVKGLISTAGLAGAIISPNTGC